MREPGSSGLAPMQVLSDVAWTGSQFVAVGYDHAGNVAFSATSTEGLTWRVGLTRWGFVPYRLAISGARFVAVCKPRLGETGLYALSSTDGAAWDASGFNLAGSVLPICDVAFGEGVFVAVGGRTTVFVGDNRGYIVSSADGKTWTERTPPQTLPNPLRAIGFSAGAFIVVGEVAFRGRSEPTGPLAYTSVDGQNYVGTSLGIEINRPLIRLNALALDGNDILISGIGDVLVRGNPTQGWTRLVPDWNPVGAPVWARNEFWFASTGSVLRTYDGILWTRHDLQRPDGGDPALRVSAFRSHTFTGEAFIGVPGGSGLPPGLRSLDGVTWTSIGLGNYNNAVASGAGLAVAVGDLGISVSRDHGMTWTLADRSTRDQLWHVAFGDGLFVALSDATTFASRDGVNWTRAALPSNTFASAMAFFRGRFYRPGGVVAGGVGNILATDDGLEWKPVFSALPGYDRFYSVTTPVVGPDGLYCSALLVRGTTESRAILFSPDGAAWQVHQASEIVPIGYGGGVFLGRGDNGVYSAAVLPAARLANLSTLGRIAGQPLITGFSIAAAEGRHVLLRSTGPGLAEFGVPDPIPALSSRVFDATGRSTEPASPVMLPLGTAETPAAVAQRVGAFVQTPQDRAELLRLRPGSYTLQTGPEAGAAGSALAEIYDAELAEVSGSVGNLSARGVLASGDAVFTAGFVIAGERGKTVLIRGVGPGLRKFGVSTTTADPRLALFDVRGTRLAESDDWNNSPDSAAVRIFGVQQGAFALDEASKDAALVTMLSPGAYTIQLSDRTRAGGEALIEVYEIR
jgi:hypothetical protein